MNKLFVLVTSLLLILVVGFSETMFTQAKSGSAAPLLETPTPPDVSASSLLSPDIVGGEEAAPGAWPWQVALIDPDKMTSESNFYNAQFCGGSLIGRRWVLTAAHCMFYRDGTLRQRDDLQVVAGIYDLASAPGSLGNQQLNVSQIIVHEDYNRNTTNNDIALLRLSTNASIENTNNSSVQLIALVNSDVGDLQGIYATVTGWGNRQAQSVTWPWTIFNTNDYPKTLHQLVNIPIISNHTCSTALGIGFNATTMLCAGDLQGGRDSCQGDSGGPLIIPNS